LLFGPRESFQKSTISRWVVFINTTHPEIVNFCCFGAPQRAK
jgi:hypothetical protein